MRDIEQFKRSCDVGGTAQTGRPNKSVWGIALRNVCWFMVGWDGECCMNRKAIVRNWV